MYPAKLDSNICIIHGAACAGQAGPATQANGPATSSSNFRLTHTHTRSRTAALIIIVKSRFVLII